MGLLQGVQWGGGAGAVLALLALASPAHAVEGDAALYFGSAPQADLKVSTASRRIEHLGAAPGTILVVTRNEIWERGYRSLAELLADLPAVDVQNLSDGTTNNRIALRGVVGNNKLLILQDGVRISSPTGDPIAVMDNFPLYHVRQVEVVYGPASALYGADAFTGVVNLITDTELTRGSEIALEGGDFGHRYGHFNTIKALGAGAQLQLGGHWREDDNADLSKHHPELFTGLRPGDRFEQPSASRSLNTRLDLSDFSFGWNHSRYSARTSIGAKPQAVDYLAGADYITLLDTAWGEWRWRLDERLSGNVVVDWSRHEVDPESEFVNVFTGYRHTGYKYSKNERRRIEPQFTWEDGPHRLTGGLSLEWLDALPKTANLPQPYDQGGPFYYPDTDLEIEIFRQRYRNRGAYLQYSGSPGDATLVHLGARYDRNSVYGDSFTPRLGLNHTLKPGAVLKYLYGEAFLAPSPFYAYENYGSFYRDGAAYKSWYFHVPNPGLQPERLKSHELRLSLNPSAGLELNAGVYRLKARDIIYRTDTPSPASDFVPGGTIFFTTHNANIGTLEVGGADAGFDYLLHGTGWKARLWGNVSVADGELEGMGETLPPPFVARAKANLGVTWTWRNRYQLTPRLRWTGAAQGPADEGRVRIPGATVVDLYARWMGPADRTELFLRADNLLDRRWYSVGDGGNSGFTRAPQEPRRVWLGVVAMF